MFFKSYKLRLELQQQVEEFNQLVALQRSRQKVLNPPPPSLNNMKRESLDEEEIPMPENLKDPVDNQEDMMMMMTTSPQELLPPYCGFEKFMNFDTQSFFVDPK